MQERLKIINLHSIQDGCSYVRHKVPFDALRARNHFIQMKFPIFRMDFEYAVLSRQFSEELIKTLFKMKAAGIKLVYDADDLLMDLEPENPFFSHKASIKGVELMKACIGLVDFVTAATSRLAVELKRYTAAPIHVFENCVDPKDWKERPREKRAAVRIGYTGSLSHLKELLFLIPIIRDLQKKYYVEFYIFGVFESLKSLEEDCAMKAAGNPAWQKMGRKILKELRTLDYKHDPFVAVEKYPAKLAELDLDIGLCPLFRSRFNDCKSNLKFLEYAMVGTAPIYADSPAYEKCGAGLKMDARTWKKALSVLIEDQDLRETFAREAKAWTLEHHNITDRIAELEAIYFSHKNKRPTIHHGIGQKELVPC